MIHRVHTIAVALALIVFSLLQPAARAQGLDDSQGTVEVTEPSAYPAKGAKQGQPKVGRKAAEKFMAPKRTEDGGSRSVAASSDSHYLATHVGFFFTDNAYKWGAPDSQSNTGKWNVGVTYRMGEWINSMDLGIRVDLASYKLNDGDATKLSFLPVVTFPDASSKFPLYFGAGAGLGVFIKQLNAESVLSLDYQLFGGVRFFNVVNSVGFFVEGGLKNHLLLLSDGQFNGTYFALGTVFTF